MDFKKAMNSKWSFTFSIFLLAQHNHFCILQGYEFRFSSLSAQLGIKRKTGCLNYAPIVRITEFKCTTKINGRRLHIVYITLLDVAPKLALNASYARASNCARLSITLNGALRHNFLTSRKVEYIYVNVEVDKTSLPELQQHLIKLRGIRCCYCATDAAGLSLFIERIGWISNNFVNRAMNHFWFVDKRIS